MVPTYVIVLCGLTAGVLYGAFGAGEPVIGRWIFSIGVGLTGGAFVAANVSGIQLIGGESRDDLAHLDGDDGPGGAPPPSTGFSSNGFSSNGHGHNGLLAPSAPTDRGPESRTPPTDRPSTPSEYGD